MKRISVLLRFISVIACVYGLYSIGYLKIFSFFIEKTLKKNISILLLKIDNFLSHYDDDIIKDYELIEIASEIHKPALELNYGLLKKFHTFLKISKIDMEKILINIENKTFDNTLNIKINNLIYEIESITEYLFANYETFAIYPKYKEALLDILNFLYYNFNDDYLLSIDNTDYINSNYLKLLVLFFTYNLNLKLFIYNDTFDYNDYQ